MKELVTASMPPLPLWILIRDCGAKIAHDSKRGQTPISFQIPAIAINQGLHAAGRIVLNRDHPQPAQELEQRLQHPERRNPMRDGFSASGQELARDRLRQLRR